MNGENPMPIPVPSGLRMDASSVVFSEDCINWLRLPLLEGGWGVAVQSAKSVPSQCTHWGGGSVCVPTLLQRRTLDDSMGRFLFMCCFCALPSRRCSGCRHGLSCLTSTGLMTTDLTLAMHPFSLLAKVEPIVIIPHWRLSVAFQRFLIMLSVLPGSSFASTDQLLYFLLLEG